MTTDSADWPDLVIADIARIDPDEVADTYPDVPIVGFRTTPTRPGCARRTRRDSTRCSSKKALLERAPQIVEELVEA